MDGLILLGRHCKRYSYGGYGERANFYARQDKHIQGLAKVSTDAAHRHNDEWLILADSDKVVSWAQQFTRRTKRSERWYTHDGIADVVEWDNVERCLHNQRANDPRPR